MLAHLFTPFAGVCELILRLALGISFFGHGREKLKNPAGFAAFLRQIHVPVPLFNAWLVALCSRPSGRCSSSSASRHVSSRWDSRSTWWWPSRPCGSARPLSLLVPRAAGGSSSSCSSPALLRSFSRVPAGSGSMPISDCEGAGPQPALVSLKTTGVAPVAAASESASRWPRTPRWPQPVR